MMFDEGVFGGHCVDNDKLSYLLMKFVEWCGGMFTFMISRMWCKCVDEERMVAFNLKRLKNGQNRVFGHLMHSVSSHLPVLWYRI